MKHQTITDCCHCQFPDTKMQVASGVIILGKISHIRHICLGGGSQVGRAADQVGHQVLKLLKLLS